MSEQNYWYGLIAEWEASDLTQSQFCDERKLSWKTFMDWRCKYIFDPNFKRPSAQDRSTGSKFKEVKVVETSTDIKAKRPANPSLTNLTITLPNSTRLTLDGELNLQELTMLCQSLSGGADAQC